MARNTVSCRGFSFSRLTLALAACFAAAGAGAQVLPTGAQVAHGTASLAQAGNTLTVTNSHGAVINWQSFSIGSGDTVRFIQPSAVSSVLNRVVNPDPSVILGQLQSNGRVFLINPAGILVGAGARIDVGHFVASTLPISDADFLAGRFQFQGGTGAGVVRNEGAIRTASGGSVYLIAPAVENAGLISAPGGEVILAAGQTVRIGDTAAPGVQVEVAGQDARAANMGTILADAGRIGVVGALVKNSGTLSATGAVADGGRVFLRAARSIEQTAAGRIEANGTQGGLATLEGGDTVLVDGAIAATGSSGSGGRIEILGGKVGLVGAAAVDASGSAGGGTVLVGGDYQGSNPEVRNAQVTWFGADASIKADATGQGDGGKVILWADDATRAYGRISARGGRDGGDGGLVEISARNHLDFQAHADLGSPRGTAGTLLLDPTDVMIASGTGLSGGGFSGGIFDGGASSVSTIGWDVIKSQLASGNVVITTSGSGPSLGNITISGSPSPMAAGSAVITRTRPDGGTWSNDYSNFAYSSANSLSLLAHKDIRVNSSFANAGTGAIKMMAGWNGSLATPSVTAGTGSILVNEAGNSAMIVNVGGAVELVAGSTVRLQGGSATGGINKVAAIDMGSGALTVTASNIELLAGAAAGQADQRNNAFIQTSGSQTFNVENGGHLWLKGGGNSGEGSDYGNQAYITAHGSGSQAFNISTGGQVRVLGGHGDGADPGAGGFPDCPAAGGTFACSNNQAHIRAEGSGSQAIAFAGNGVLQVKGGTSSATRGNNGANIGAESGPQTISGDAAISIESGAGAGGFVSGTSRGDNEAGIFAEGVQNVSGSSLTLDASATYGVGGAILAGRDQTINIAGNVLLAGGGSSAPVAPAGVTLPSESQFPAGAVIGFDEAATTRITAGGTFTMNAGSGTGGATHVGTVRGRADITLNAQAIALNGSAAARAGLGAKDGSGGTIALTSASTVSQNAAGGMHASSLTVDAQGQLSLLGENRVDTVALETVSGNIAYTSHAPVVHVEKARVRTSGNVSIKTAGADAKHIALGQVWVPLANAVNITAQGAILDDNGAGMANITAGSIALATISGGNPGPVVTTAPTSSVTTASTSTSVVASGLAVSADVVAPGGSVSVTVPAAAGDGGIRIHSLGTAAPTTLNLSDATTTGLGDIFFQHDGDLTAGSAYSLSSASGSVIAHGTGDFMVSGASFSGPLGVVLAAGGSLNIASNLSINGDLQLHAAKGITLGGTVSNLGFGTAFAYAPEANISVSSSGALKSDGAQIVAGTLDIAGEVEGTEHVSATAGQVNIAGGAVKSSLGGVAIQTPGDIRMAGGLISAGDTVSLMLKGATSTLYVNGSAAQPAARIVSGTNLAAGLIKLDFPLRSEGGVVIDGVPTLSTSAGGSGFYNGTTPAASGAGLLVNYGVTRVIQQETVNDLLASTQSPTDSSTSTTGSSPNPDTATTSVVKTAVSTAAATGPTSGTDGAGVDEFAASADASAPAGTDSSSTPASTSSEEQQTASKDGNDAKSSGKDDGKTRQGKKQRSAGVCT